MKAVSNLRTRMRMLSDGSEEPRGAAPAEAVTAAAATANEAGGSARRRACTAGADAVLSPPLAESTQRAWAVGARKLRGLHPSPVLIYVRENAAAVVHAMDRLYGALVTRFNVDSRDIRVTDVPTAFDLPAAVRRMGLNKQLVVVVALLTRDTPWFDGAQVGRVRQFLLDWSQANAVPLVDGVLVADTQRALVDHVSAPRWRIAASDDIGGGCHHVSAGVFGHADADAQVKESTSDSSSFFADSADDSAAAKDIAFVEPSTTAEIPPPENAMFGDYLAHRAIEMFYFEHRGW
ncbi:hypothetical protein COEREDRAFT_82867 [Coemansia reversa NRRL 1564]|uniref:6,7-dimethyl-8-ribityllumazine synthase n=1 Tax=Coemansia reversa (strain ATCC 12441 / NRRL 1564) TaxID=763665 RepID=A0A2G5B5A5_COERN|nr:hypothetical protein COEREDRAFT_82867 [Coemansia reversa NRRL 1564]|eukprot:PIA14186.1 hypothetical protein COEREDRAFT_82867 [Coemansia reversa NRRL 1564]